MCRRRGLDHPDGFKCCALGVEVLEQPDPVAEEHGDEVKLHLVDQSGLQALLDHVRATHDQDVLPIGSRRRIVNGGLDPVQDEVERRPPLGKAVWLVLRSTNHG